MDARFDVVELVRVAIIEERTGVAFYGALAQKAADAQLRAVFAKMSEQEKVHETRFQDMLEGLEQAKRPEGYPDEYVAYIETLVTRGTWAERSAAATSRDYDDDMEALDTALGLERDQLVLMQDMAHIIGGKHRQVIEAIIKEEQAHVVELTAAKRRLLGG